MHDKHILYAIILFNSMANIFEIHVQLTSHRTAQGYVAYSTCVNLFNGKNRTVREDTQLIYSECAHT